jgi:hypothetical protein
MVLAKRLQLLESWKGAGLQVRRGRRVIFVRRVLLKVLNSSLAPCLLLLFTSFSQGLSVF